VSGGRWLNAVGSPLEMTALDPKNHATSRSRLRWDLACVGLVLISRAALLIGARNDPVFRIPYLDGAFYHTWARSLAAHEGDFQGPYFLGPLYPYFVALAYAVAHPDPWVVRLVQSAFGVLDGVLVLLVGRRVFGVTASRAAVVLYAGYGPLVFYENLLVMEALTTTLALVALALAVVPRAREPWRAAFIGLLIGLASLGRPTFLVALPAALYAFHELRSRPPRSQAVRFWILAAVATATCLLVVLPVVVRNARLGGGITITTNGGVNFYAGNNPNANGRFHEPPGVRFFRDPVLTSSAQTALPPAVAARALTVRSVAGTEDAANSKMWFRRSLAWIRSQPLAALELLLRRVWLVLQAREIAQIESYEFHARRLGVLHPFVVDFGWLWPLALLGGWRAAQSRRIGWRGIAAFAAAMLVPCLLFFVTSRYRAAAVPVVVLVAGFGVQQSVTWFRERAWRSVVLAALAVAPVAVLARVDARPPRGAEGWGNAQMAERLYASGDLAGAIHYQQIAAAQLPDRWEPALNLALYRSERGAPEDLERAVQELAELERRWPGEPLVAFNLGLLLEQQGRLPAARAAWKAALAADPTFEPARSRLLQSVPTAPTPQK
jgi:4-amino-4-deoxy-L-arabinose transferase-like glycosyltransferase